jgi:hypothetical protein
MVINDDDNDDNDDDNNNTNTNNNNNSLREVQYMTRMGERIVAYVFLMRKPETEKSLGRPRSRWDVTLK